MMNCMWNEQFLIERSSFNRQLFSFLIIKRMVSCEKNIFLVLILLNIKVSFSLLSVCSNVCLSRILMASGRVTFGNILADTHH